MHIFCPNNPLFVSAMHHLREEAKLLSVPHSPILGFSGSMATELCPSTRPFQSSLEGCCELDKQILDKSPELSEPRLLICHTGRTLTSEPDTCPSYPQASGEGGKGCVYSRGQRPRLSHLELLLSPRLGSERAGN